MKVNHTHKGTRSGFTLIEMIGVLAVIAILAALLIPKVFAAINSSKVSNTSTSLNTIKTAAIDHYAKFGTLTVDGSGATPVALTLPVAQYDQVLLKESFLDKMFAVKIGDGINSTTNSRVQLVAAITTAADGTGAAYNLDGDTATGGPVGGTATGNDAIGSYVLETVITGVAVADAQDLNRIMDGTAPNLGEASGADIGGRVTYAAPGSDGTVTVYVYLTHR